MDALEHKAAADLQWDDVLEAMASRCAGTVAAERMRAVRPSGARGEAETMAARAREAAEALAEGEPIPAAAVDDVRGIVERARRGGEVGGEELRLVARALAAARSVRQWLKGREERSPALAVALSSEARLDRLEQEIDRCIEPGGRVSDAASPALRKARQQIAIARKGLREKLDQLGSAFADVLREGGPVERDGRYGLPVRSDAHRRVEGIVLGASATGATIYVEPPAITDLSNRVRLAEAEVAREEARIVAELTAGVASDAEAVLQASDAAVEADRFAAIARWARDAGAVVLPIDPEPVIELVAVRHPLLVEQRLTALARGKGVREAPQVVANDVSIAGGRALVVSGPNAGGKTVTLKCLGLAAWLVRAGLPLPADGRSRVGWFEPVLTDIGDEQSLERSLSTFSAHVVSYARIVGAARPGALVLLDEVAGSTDPEEGSALAVALLEALVASGAAVVTTTHYQRLEQRASEDPRFENAAVGFDLEGMQPTFSLRMGRVGASAALAAAQRHGLPATVVERARELLPQQVVLRERLIAELEREERRWREARREAEAELGRARQLREELEHERAVVRNKERQKLADEAAELRNAIRGARARVRELERRSREAPDAMSAREAERMVDEAARLVAVGGPVDKATRDEPRTEKLAPDEIAPGAIVYVARLRGTAEILEHPARGQVRVQAGAFALRVPIAELSRPARSRSAAKKEREQPRRRGGEAFAGVAVAAAPAASVIRTSGNTCDLRGQRVEDALENLDRFIDRCLGDNEPVAFVLHGHGTGALRQAVREHLALSPHVGESRAATMDEGGDAFTIFWLKD